MTPKKPVRTIREHKKSRLGCFTCKRRKVKCDLGRPICGACNLRSTKCGYPEHLLDAEARPRHGTAAHDDVAAQQNTAVVSRRRSAALVAQPAARLPSSTATDMKLLWFFTANTSRSFLSERFDKRGFGATMQTLVVQEALEHDFLLKTLFVLAGLHMQHLGQQAVDGRTMARYHAEAFQGYRAAIEDAAPATFPALLANSVLVQILPCGRFRDPDAADLYVLDWLVLWRGIKCIISLCPGPAAGAGAGAVAGPGLQTGVGQLLARPPLDVDGARSAIPPRLRRMVDGITAAERDYESAAAYRKALVCLGSLYSGLTSRDLATTALAVLTWATYLPDEFIRLARARAPRALVILGHYGAFLKVLEESWWAEGLGDRCIRDIGAYLGPEWRHEMETPLSVAMVGDREEVLRVLRAAAGNSAGNVLVIE